MTDLTVALLGTGIMGVPMARNMLKAGISVRVWNRTRDKAEPLAADGAVICAEPAEAAAGAQVVLTILRDGDAVTAIMSGVLPAMEEGAVWVQSSTVGVAAADRLAELAAERDVPFVDAPVLGTRQPAEAGMLTVLASGPEEVRETVRPVFEAVGSRTIWAGTGTQASRLKLVNNNWVLALTTALGETFALSQALDLDPALFLQIIAGGPMDAGYAQIKGAQILADDFQPSFKTETAAKDAALIAEAGRAAGITPLVTEAIRDQMRRAVALGHGDKDMAAVYHAAREPEEP